MAGEAAREVLERLLLAVPPPPESRGSLLVAVGDAGGPARPPPCTLTVAAAGELVSDLDPKILRGAPRGALELPGVPCPPSPCCQRILERARLRAAFQLSTPPDCAELERFLHRVSVVHPQVEFHFCVRVNGAAASHTYGPEHVEGAQLRVQSWHFIPPAAPWGAPPCLRIHPRAGPPIRLRVPPGAAGAGLGGELSVAPAAALCPCLRPLPNLPTRLAALAIFLWDPAGLPAAPTPQILGDPSWLADWAQFGITLTPHTPRGGEGDLGGGVLSSPLLQIPPDAAYAVQPPPGPPGHPQTLLLFLTLRLDDPFQGYDAGTRRLLLSHLEQALGSSRRALARGTRSLLHPELQALRRRQQSQQRLARSLPVAAQAVAAVVAGSTSARFRRDCLGLMQVPDPPALALAWGRRWAEVTQGRRVPRVGCETPPGVGQGGHGAARQEEEEEEEEEEGHPRPRGSQGQAQQPQAGLYQRLA